MKTADEIWLPSPPDMDVPEGEVHVWRMALDLPEPELEALQSHLATSELARAARYHFERDRRRYLVRRGRLRIILGHCLDLEPGSLQFSYNAYGKPALAPELSDQKLYFNLSHSGEYALCAVCRGYDVGVDIERMRTDIEFEAIGERFFSTNEVAVLESVPAEARAQAFYNCWTRKEAYIKGRGEGLSIPLGSFDVSLAPGEPAALLASRWDPEDEARWRMQALIPGEGYAGALIVKGEGWALRCWQWIPQSHFRFDGRIP
jgi:4'-phosphopantetheinyl transferase